MRSGVHDGKEVVPPLGSLPRRVRRPHRERKYLGRIGAFDRPAIEDADLCAGVAVGRNQALAERGVHLGDILDRRDLPVPIARSARTRQQGHHADRPGRRGKLHVDRRNRRAGLPGVERFADAQDHRVRAERSFSLGFDVGVGFPLRIAPLAMADDGEGLAPRSPSISDETQPVCAPLGAKCTSWLPMAKPGLHGLPARSGSPASTRRRRLTAGLSQLRTPAAKISAR